MPSATVRLQIENRTLQMIRDEQMDRIKELAERIEKLEADNDRLRRENEALKAHVGGTVTLDR
jgi:cell division protein FtsB